MQPTSSPHPGVIDPPTRFLAGVLTLRDIRDLEQHVAGFFDGLGLRQPELRSAVLAAIGDAYRLDRALPSEHALEPLLYALLAARAARLRTGLDARLPRVA